MSDSLKVKEFFWIDSHAHLDDLQESQLETALENARQVGVRQIVLAGTHPEGWMRQLEIQKKYSTQKYGIKIHLNFGLHPWWVEKYSSAEIENILYQLKTLLPEASALGETGLDFASKRDPSQFEKQEHAFQEQIKIAQALNKPLVLHVVQAHAKGIEILKANEFKAPFVLHRYSGNVTELKEYLKMDAYFSFDQAILSQKGYEKTKKALLHTPLDRLLFETDSNEPAQVIAIYEHAATLLGVKPTDLKEKVAENMQKIGYHMAHHE